MKNCKVTTKLHFKERNLLIGKIVRKIHFKEINLQPLQLCNFQTFILIYGLQIQGFRVQGFQVEKQE